MASAATFSVSKPNPLTILLEGICATAVNSLAVSVADGKDFADMNVFWDCVIGQIKIQNVRKFIQNGTKCAVTKDSRRLNLEEGEIQASRVTLVMRDTITSFLRGDIRVIKPFRSVSWSAVHDNTNDHTGKGLEAADMEYNGNDQPQGACPQIS